MKYPVADARFGPLLVALLLGTGLGLTTLGIFGWLQSAIYVYSRHPDLNYLLGEVGGHAAPGLGLLSCGIVLAWSFFPRPNNGRNWRQGADLKVPLHAGSQPPGPRLGVLPRL